MRNETRTLCWRCNTPYQITEHDCPKCEAINPNVDLDGAIDQIEAERDESAEEEA